MRRVGSRLLLSQIGISILVSLLLGISMLTLAREYFIDSIENALDVQASLISEALFSESASISPTPPEFSEFNTVQQQIGNLSVEIQGIESSELVDPLSSQELSRRIEAFESIELVVAYTTLQGEPVLRPEGSDLPASVRQPELSNPNYSRSVEQDLQDRNWLVKSYPVAVEGRQAGTLTLAQPLQAIQAVLEDLGARVLIAGAVSLMVALGVSILSTRGLTGPITALMKASRSIPDGQYDDPLPIERKDELGELGRTFEEMRNKLQSLEALRTQFVSDVSHELRTPLTAIKGLAETLQDGAVEDPRVRDRFLEAIERETDRLIRMTQDLLTLTRVDGKNLALKIKPIDFIGLLEDTLLTLSPNLDEKDLHIKLDLPDQHVLVDVDEDRWKQILFNVIHNAIQHSPPGGEIDINLMIGSPQDPILQKALNHSQPLGGKRPQLDIIERYSHWGLLKIQDQGVGIPATDLQQVFERFYRAESSRDRLAGGAGLGLSIALALAEAHNAYLWIHSPPPGERHHGTLVMLWFPFLHSP